MKWHRFAGLVVIVMAASCGSESPPPSTAPDHVGTSQATATAKEATTTQATATAAKEVTTNAGAPGSDKPQPETAKPSAPVNVAASFRAGGADLDVVFGADGSDVTMKVWGVDGLKVTKGTTPIAIASVRNGQTTKIVVDYDQPATTANLAVSVSGKFGGREQVKVQSFTINAGNAAATAPSDVKVDGEGRRVKVMKSP